MTKTILVVDDERSIRESLRKVLQAEAYHVVTAENGQEAVDKYEAEPVDLLLLDLSLPVKDGWETLAWLAKVNPLLPIILITGRSNQSELAKKVGADALMEKPLDVPRLLELIRELMSEPLEHRAQRVNLRPADFRYVCCDPQVFREMLLKRMTLPFPCAQFQDR